MKVRVLPVEAGLEPKFRIIAETAEDEVFLKQLAGMYGDATLSLEDVIFNGDGVSSLVVIGDTFPFPGDFCERVQQCMAGFTPEQPAVQPPATVLIQDTTFNLDGFNLNFKGNVIDGDQLERDFDSNGNDLGGVNNSVGNSCLFNQIVGGGNSIGSNCTTNNIIGGENTIQDDCGLNLIIGSDNTIQDDCLYNAIFGSLNELGDSSNGNFLAGANHVVSNNVQFSAAWGVGHNVTCDFSYMFGRWGVCPGGGLAIGNGTDNLNRNNSHLLKDDGSYQHDGAYANKPTRYTAGGSVTIPDNVGTWIYDPAVIQAAAIIALPATPFNGQRQTILAGGTITSGTVVTALTLNGNGNGILGTIPASLDAGILELVFSSVVGAWYLK